MVPAANKKPMNRSKNRMPDIPFLNSLPQMQLILPLKSGNFTTDRTIRTHSDATDSAVSSAIIYNAAAVSKLGL